jgi:polygalacturonase
MFRKYAVIAYIIMFVFSISAGGQKQLKDYFTNLPFPMPEMKEPQFPNRTFSIVEYGAIADGHTMNTKPFADAIAACVKTGGGTVLVPPGTWLTGPIKLESNINLHVEKGALVQFSKNIDDYPFIQNPDGKSKRFGRTPLISVYKASNIAFTGEGIFNGAGEVWRYVLHEDLTELQWKALVASGGVVSVNGEAWWPSKEAIEAELFLKSITQSKKELTVEDYEKTREYLRPSLINLIQCNDILFDGPTFENSPKFHILPVQCENLIIRNVKVFAPVSGKNTDAIDPAACRNVLIYNCLIDVGDDGICLKPGAIAESQKPGPACENIVVADCVVYHAHGGFVIGSESYGGVRNVSVRNCVFIGTDVGLRFKSARDRGGLVENIFFEGIQMREIVTDAILFDMYYSGGSPDVEARKDLTIRKIADADGVQLNGCKIVPQSGAVFNVISSCNVTVNGGSYPSATDMFMKVVGETSENIRLIGVDVKQAKNAVELDANVKVNAVKQE